MMQPTFITIPADTFDFLAILAHDQPEESVKLLALLADAVRGGDVDSSFSKRQADCSPMTRIIAAHIAHGIRHGLDSYRNATRRNQQNRTR